MIGLAVAVGLAAGVDWRRLVMLATALTFPIPALLALAVLYRRRRPDTSMRAATFCDAVSSELRAGASLRSALETAAASIDAPELAAIAGEAPMTEVARAASTEFPEIGSELNAILNRAQGMGVGPAALFDEMGNLALAQAEVTHEVSVASAPAKAAAVVLLLVPTIAVVVTAIRGGFASLLLQPAQRAAAALGAVLVAIGLVTAITILKRAK